MNYKRCENRHEHHKRKDAPCHVGFGTLSKQPASERRRSRRLRGSSAAPRFKASASSALSIAEASNRFLFLALHDQLKQEVVGIPFLLLRFEERTGFRGRERGAAHGLTVVHFGKAVDLAELDSAVLRDDDVESKIIQRGKVRARVEDSFFDLIVAGQEKPFERNARVRMPVETIPLVTIGLVLDPYPVQQAGFEIEGNADSSLAKIRRPSRLRRPEPRIRQDAAMAIRNVLVIADIFYHDYA